MVAHEGKSWLLSVHIIPYFTITVYIPLHSDSVQRLHEWVPSELGVLTSAPFFSSCAYGKEYLLAAWKRQHRTFSHVTKPTKIFCAFVFFFLLFMSIVFLSVFESFWVFPELSRKMTVCPYFKCFLELEYSEDLTVNISWWTCLRYTANQYFAQMWSARRQLLNECGRTLLIKINNKKIKIKNQKMHSFAFELYQNFYIIT